MNTWSPAKTRTVFCSEHRAVLDAHAAHARKRLQWRRRVQAWAERRGVRPELIIRDGRILAVAHPVDAPIPPGWRRCEPCGEPLTPAILPNRRTTVGQACAEELTRDLVPPPDVYSAVPGMRRAVMVNGYRATWAPELRENGRALYAVWDHEVPFAVARRELWIPVDVRYYTHLLVTEG